MKPERFLVLYCVGQNESDPTKEAESFTALGVETMKVLALKSSSLYSLQVDDYKDFVSEKIQLHLVLVSMAVRYDNVRQHLQKTSTKVTTVETFAEALAVVKKE